MITWEKKNIFRRLIKGTDEQGHLFYRTLGDGYICILDNGKALGWSDNSPEEALKWAQQNIIERGEGCKM